MTSIIIDYLFSIFFVVVMMSITSLTFNKTLIFEYNGINEQNRKSTWNNLVLKSAIWGILLGLLSVAILLYTSSKVSLSIVLMSTVIGYALRQTVTTDFFLHKGDRYMLRMGYIIAFCGILDKVFTEYTNYIEAQLVIYMAIVTYVALIILFIFSNVGASDIRGYMIVLPFTLAYNIKLGLTFFILINIFIIIEMTAQQVKAKKKIRIPILPYILLPYAAFIPLLPLITK